MNFFKRCFWECFKIMPFLALVIAGAWYLGDFSQLKLAGYWLTIICMTVLVTHIGRKFMYPSLSIEAHCNSAKLGNLASACIVFSFFLFQIAISWLVVICVTAMMSAPPKNIGGLAGIGGSEIEQVEQK